MKRVIFHLIYAILFFAALYPVTYVASSFGIFGEAEFGYYEEYNIARHAVKESCDVTLLDKGLLHTDFGIRYFSLCTMTKSGWRVDLFFYNGMGVREVCYNFKGILVNSPVRGTQVYSAELLDELLRDKNLRLRGVKDVLCSINELAPVLQANYANETIPIRGIDTSYNGYLQIDNVPWNTALEEGVIREFAPVEASHLIGINRDGRSQYGYSYECVSLDNTGNLISKNRRQANSYLEHLGDGVNLEMVKIPGGTFLMGTSDAEVERLLSGYHSFYQQEQFKKMFKDSIEWEKPQHRVRLQNFYMGKFEVTQAQWRAVANLPKVEIELNPDPSTFKGDDRPVETVSWQEAVEFCARLSKATGREYRLPSEAEWEYACRAGTTTRFHFGDALATRLANFNGERCNGFLPWGINREETMPVGYFRAANDFGLYDMHGNVDEYCQDAWHEDYKGAPSDGSAWFADGEEATIVIRGGAWGGGAIYNRATSRHHWIGKKRGDYLTGFRVVAVEKN